jgi:hypothetical protein
MLKVTLPLDPPPLNPVPAVTALISPGKFVVVKTLVSVMFPLEIDSAPAATAIVANDIELAGVAGAVGDPAGVPARTDSTTLFREPV